MHDDDLEELELLLDLYGMEVVLQELSTLDEDSFEHAVELYYY